MNLLYLGMLIRWALAVFGTGAVATSDTTKSAQDVSALISGLPHDWQLILGALATIAPLVWSWIQKRGWLRRDAELKAPVEERTL